jgi:hypothetical protein
VHASECVGQVRQWRAETDFRSAGKAGCVPRLNRKRLAYVAAPAAIGPAARSRRALQCRGQRPPVSGRKHRSGGRTHRTRLRARRSWTGQAQGVRSAHPDPVGPPRAPGKAREAREPGHRPASGRTPRPPVLAPWTHPLRVLPCAILSPKARGALAKTPKKGRNVLTKRGEVSIL